MKNLSITNSEKKQNKTNKNSERAGLVSNAKFEVNVISRPVRGLKANNPSQTREGTCTYLLKENIDRDRNTARRELRVKLDPIGQFTLPPS